MLDDDLPTLQTIQTQFKSDRARAREIIEKTPSLHEHLVLYVNKVVKIWLEETSKTKVKFEQKQSSLQYTIDYLQNKLHKHSDTDKIVSCLDPDAKNRERKSLVAEDQVCFV